MYIIPILVSRLDNVSGKLQTSMCIFLIVKKSFKNQIT